MTHKEVIQNRKAKEKNKRIESILEAAKKVFFSKGYLHTSMDDIALLAEISKPTIYQYFPSKDSLFFSLMIPVIEDINIQLKKTYLNLINGKYKTGSSLIKALFKGICHSYEISPEVFKLIQLFQQTHMVWQLDEETRTLLNQKGRDNFAVSRDITKKAIEKGLFKNMDSYGLNDVLWGLLCGVIQLEDIKSQNKPNNKYLKTTLKLAEKIFIDAISIKE